jgi:hypothetical protein
MPRDADPQFLQLKLQPQGIVLSAGITLADLHLELTLLQELQV